MVISPIEYFERQNINFNTIDNSGMSEEEQYLVQNYLGLDEELGSKEITIQEQKVGSKDKVFIQETVINTSEVATDNYIRSMPELHLVGFQLGSQLYSVPTTVVQEVVRKMSVFRLPVASNVISGVIKLRKNITPLVQLSRLFKIANKHSSDVSMFTIVCNYQKLQFGIQIDSIHSMYRVVHEDVQWNVETLLGVAGEYIIGLFKLCEKLVPIISVERIVADVFQGKE